ncbi:hypothetical protein [Pseudonocardia acaciae]|uniref:hypothetical protein n=1 Tax=Pseudonocardia acaciae TaxID=551276 RepID=UPI00048F614B|nr:hypothetical protein [Pseudonocardia acaciae]
MGENDRASGDERPGMMLISCGANRPFVGLSVRELEALADAIEFGDPIEQGPRTLALIDAELWLRVLGDHD